MKDVYKFLLSCWNSIAFFVYIYIYMYVFVYLHCLHCLGISDFPMIYPESVPPTSSSGFERVKVGGPDWKRRWMSQISFGKRDVFPFFVCLFKMLGTFEKKTQMFLWMIFWGCVFFLNTLLSIFFWLDFCVLLWCWWWQSEKQNSERMRALLRDTKPFVEHLSFLVTTLKSERIQIQLMNILHRSPKDTRGRCTSAQSP